MVSCTLTIKNAKGLHARAAAKFVKTVEQFDVRVKVSNFQDTVDGTSILGLMLLGASSGTKLAISAEGPHADQALHALSELFDSKFGEER